MSSILDDSQNVSPSSSFRFTSEISHCQLNRRLRPFRIGCVKKRIASIAADRERKRGQQKPVYPGAFRYYRPSTLEEASSILAELGEDAKALAGGQSLIPLMKLRLSVPSALVDLNYIPDLGHIKRHNGTLHIGAMARHADIENSAEASKIAVLHDCAAGIADVQVRNRGTIGGSVAEADPSGDWGAVLLTLDTEVHAIGPNGARNIPLTDFFLDAYTTALAPGELVKEIRVKAPAKGTGGALRRVQALRAGVCVGERGREHHSRRS